jgi:hypothetical protein
MQKIKIIDNRGRMPVATFIGGMRHGAYNFTIPLVRLEFFVDGLRLSSSTRLLRRAVPILEARFEDISNVQVVGNWLGSGIRIQSKHNEPAVVFWSTSPEKVLSLFHNLGLNVNTEKGRFHFLDPDR